tara:strand:+ start:132 stop:644 length:513 start_codon:yes stop_codon:yes gene_type:complete
MDKFKEFISSYNNFPKKGVDFKDVLGIAQHPSVFSELITKMASTKIIKNAEAIISIDARGFIFGSALSLLVSKPMITARKPGKLPGELVHKKYSLEYGENSLSMQKDSLKNFNSFAIVDDLLATGGTSECVYKLVNEAQKKVTGLIVAVELEKLNARKKLKFPILSIIKY